MTHDLREPNPKLCLLVVTCEWADHAGDVAIEVLDLVVVGDPGRGDLSEKSGSFDPVFQGRVAAAQQLVDHRKPVALKQEIDGWLNHLGFGFQGP